MANGATEIDTGKRKVIYRRIGSDRIGSFLARLDDATAPRRNEHGPTIARQVLHFDIRMNLHRFWLDKARSEKQ